jgi:hypothetical protein
VLHARARRACRWVTGAGPATLQGVRRCAQHRPKADRAGRRPGAAGAGWTPGWAAGPRAARLGAGGRGRRLVVGLPECVLALHVPLRIVLLARVAVLGQRRQLGVHLPRGCRVRNYGYRGSAPPARRPPAGRRALSRRSLAVLARRARAACPPSAATTLRTTCTAGPWAHMSRTARVSGRLTLAALTLIKNLCHQLNTGAVQPPLQVNAAARRRAAQRGAAARLLLALGARLLGAAVADQVAHVRAEAPVFQEGAVARALVAPHRLQPPVRRVLRARGAGELRIGV